MSYGIDAAVQAMKPPRRHAQPDRFLTDPKAPQLADRNNSVLSSGELGDPEVGCGDFPIHIHG
jgi:hypothetical protein